jgi:hypothetical protein
MRRTIGKVAGTGALQVERKSVSSARRPVQTSHTSAPWWEKKEMKDKDDDRTQRNKGCGETKKKHCTIHLAS